MDQSNLKFDTARTLPMMALRGLTVYPAMLLNFDVERPGSIAALDRAMKDDQIIFLAAQKDIAVDVPEVEDVYSVGTVCRIKQMMKQPGSKTVRVMVEGIDEKGRLNLSRREALIKVKGMVPENTLPERGDRERRPRRDDYRRDDRRDDRRPRRNNNGGSHN